MMCAIAVVLCWIVPTQAEVRIAVSRNEGRSASGAFVFKSVPPPSKDDAATKARVEIVQGRVDPGSGGLGTLTDGLVPGVLDDPDLNFFFMAGTSGGCFRIDLGTVKEVTQVNTYSWHSNTRGPQVYTLYGSDGAGSGFSVSPKRVTDPVAVGWKLLAQVDTRTPQATIGGQYGVSITDSAGKLGTFRFLLLCCSVTESDDEFGNTFYSEVDVVAR